jgi:hypothetical protein
MGKRLATADAGLASTADTERKLFCPDLDDRSLRQIKE